MEKSPGLSGFTPYLTKYGVGTPEGAGMENSISLESHSPANIRSPSLSPYLTQAVGSSSASCSSSPQSPSASPLTLSSCGDATRSESRASSSLVSPLLCLASSPQRRTTLFEPKPSGLFFDGVRSEEAAAGAAACLCRRLVELVEIHSTISRIVADSEQEGTQGLEPELAIADR